MKVIKKEEVDFANKQFYIIGYSKKNRERGEEMDAMPQHYDDGPDALVPLEALYITNVLKDVETVVVKTMCQDEYKMWRAACHWCHKTCVKLVYQIDRTKYFVDNTSDPDMLQSLMPKPAFYKNIGVFFNGYNPYTGLKEWEDQFGNNLDIIKQLKLQCVGPQMPALHKEFVIYHNDLARKEDAITRYEQNIIGLREDIAERKVKMMTSKMDSRLMKLINVDRVSDTDPNMFSIVCNIYCFIYGLGTYSQYSEAPYDQIMFGDAYDSTLNEAKETLKWYFHSLRYRDKVSQMNVFGEVKRWNCVPSMHQGWMDDLLIDLWNTIIDGGLQS